MKHLVIDDLPDGSSTWEREIFQRNALVRGLAGVCRVLECLVVSAVCYGMYILTPYTPVYRAYSHTLYTCVQGGLAHVQLDDLSIVVCLSLSRTHTRTDTATHCNTLRRTATPR